MLRYLLPSASSILVTSIIFAKVGPDADNVQSDILIRNNGGL